MKSPGWSLVVHGGSGVIDREDLKPEQDRAYRAVLARAAETGAAVLRLGGAALDAVEAAIHVLEDDPLFNSGRGAVFTADGRVELDAAIMDGATLAAGAVAGVTRVRNPISAARAVMERSPHVLMAGSGADAFARAEGLAEADPGYFFVERRWRALEKQLTREGLPVPVRPHGASQDLAHAALAHDEGKRGTVGVVARDARGHVAAGTSTGGTTGKRWGRVGDSPLIGAGTYASDRSAAVSGTGEGEYFIRLSVAHRICALVELKGLSLQAAVDEVIHGELTALGGQGGVIAVAPDGQMAWGFNTSGMYRARVADGRPLEVSIYKDEP
ncbi:isoaspartyl peptidase/L-asparaginase [Phenylobacterium sp.]|jgi:beta-aspartyl-peptidase (threonine type)|uniref:isoaspartyl peptidase/L-asparaginase family protein n=1 Tax=Phenylobacterium sp. TaxID=1871053 RepID=UPI002E334567|nr:isoaspartyl peptidase/L-asparaginase [Phenylobacterium sp.]HEX3365355.1 isoaspartyl peptidase/L-asparaginase [Phenylobacterium sp.]